MLDKTFGLRRGKSDLLAFLFKVLDLTTTSIGSPRAQRVLEGLERGEAGPWPQLSRPEKIWIARKSRIPSERLEELLHVPGRTIRRWRQNWHQDRLARRDEEIWSLYQQRLSLAEIGRRVGLTPQRVGQIVAERQAGRRRRRRLF
jgi:hypothetical protein